MASHNMRLVLGTRGSRLALAQTDIAARRVRASTGGIEIEVVTIRTEADDRQDTPVSALGDKGVWVNALERALLEGRIDVAVHSLKDVPSDQVNPVLGLAAFLPRDDPRDAFIGRDAPLLKQLPAGSSVGTSSARRRAQLRMCRPDLRYTDMRGNVDTRLAKLDRGDVDALVLAAAGLSRLELGSRITEYLPAGVVVPDAGQGIIALQCRARSWAADMVSECDDLSSRAQATAERAAVRALGADCRSPVGAFAQIAGNRLRLSVAAARDEHQPVVRDEIDGDVDDAEALGRELGRSVRRLLDRGSSTYTGP